jgi:hypothetical protein
MDEVAEINKRLEAKRAQIRADAMRAIGRHPDGTPMPPGDLAEETRLTTSDLRAPLAEAIAERHQIALRVADRKDAAERAQQHLDAAMAELASREDRNAAAIAWQPASSPRRSAWELPRL